MRTTINENLAKLQEIAILPPNWNENGAPPFSPNLIEMAKEMLLNLNHQPFIAPTARGSIHFEYEDNEGNYLQFELLGDGIIKMFSYTSIGVASVRYVLLEEVPEIVGEFFEG